MKKQGNNKTLVLIGLLLGLVFSELDQTVVSTALPTIIRDLHGMSLYGWVAGIYMLSITIFRELCELALDLSDQHSYRAYRSLYRFQRLT